MKVLFVSAWFPWPADNGSRIRVYNLIKALARRHEVHLISLLQEDSRRENAAGLSDICHVVSLHESRWFAPGTFKSLLGFFSSRPRSCVDTFDPAVKAAVENAIREVQPDALIASTLGVVEYVPEGLAIPSVLDEHNCEYAVMRRSAARVANPVKRLRADLGWKKTARWEAKMCRRYSAVAMVSEGDKEQILRACPVLPNVHVIPNGVDTDHYTTGSRAPVADRFVYNGALTYSANLDAVRYYAAEVYPVLKQRRPDAKLVVTGRTTGVDLSGIQDCPGIELVGYVDDIRDVLRTSAACVVPLREGGGSRLKILEAMASGVPVISTSMGAEGIDAWHGDQILIADSAADLADAIVSISESPDAAAKITANARRLVEERYGWRAIGEDFVELVESVAQGRTCERVGA